MILQCRSPNNRGSVSVNATLNNCPRVDSLIAAGYPSSSISVLLPDARSTKDFAHEKATKAPEGTAAGVTAGGVIGGTIGVLAGVGALAIPGLGPFIAAGPIMAALSGAAIGATAGGIVGGLIGLGIPEIEAKRYEEKLKKGNYLISVHVNSGEQEDRAKSIFKQNMAEDIATAGESAVPTPAHAS